jgi:ferritin-like metal-binding protein YciE
MTSIDEQLNAYLSDAHAIEEQALPQMRAAPGMAGDTERTVKAILDEERAMENRLAGNWDLAVDASLAAQELPV